MAENGHVLARMRRQNLAQARFHAGAEDFAILADLGGNASKFFALVYNLKRENRLYQRFPSVEGSYYFIAGIGVNYLRSGGVTLAPMRTGVGIRTGVNAHYQVYSDRRDWFPL